MYPAPLLGEPQHQFLLPTGGKGAHKGRSRGRCNAGIPGQSVQQQAERQTHVQAWLRDAQAAGKGLQGVACGPALHWPIDGWQPLAAGLTSVARRSPTCADVRQLRLGLTVMMAQAQHSLSVSLAAHAVHAVHAAQTAARGELRVPSLRPHLLSEQVRLPSPTDALVHALMLSHALCLGPFSLATLAQPPEGTTVGSSMELALHAVPPSPPMRAAAMGLAIRAVWRPSSPTILDIVCSTTHPTCMAGRQVCGAAGRAPSGVATAPSLWRASNQRF